MDKWYGKVGYVTTEEIEIEPGIWAPDVVEREYYGDIPSKMSRWSQGGKVNDDLSVSVKLSIMADPYAFTNFQSIKYAEYMGALWEVNVAEPALPRIILTLGGVYNGQTPRVTE